MVKDFFVQREEHSKIKSEIVVKYFCSWANVMIGHQSKLLPRVTKRIAYIDLYSGPGRYEDGTPSTPILILEEVIRSKKYREWVATVFNDINPEYYTKLKEEISNIPGIDQLNYSPRILNKIVDDNFTVIFEETEVVPALCFFDPWGYKGLSLRFFYSILKNFGCDLLIFFNYNRINMSLFNKLFVKDMYALFGQDKANELKNTLRSMTPSNRGGEIIKSFFSVLHDYAKYTFCFCFKKPDGIKISHHLVFASKNILGYNIFKEIAASYSTRHNQGVPSFEYNPLDNSFAQLIETYRPLDELCSMLSRDFSGQTLIMQKIFERHHIGKPYLQKNYKDALLKMEENFEIKTDPPAEKRRMIKGKPTFGPNVKVSFPPHLE